MQAVTENLAAEKPAPNVMKAATAMWDGLTALNTELVNCAHSSWRATLAAAEQARKCQSPQDVIELQMRLGQQRYEECLDQTRKISEMFTRIQTDAISALAPDAR